MAFGNAEIGLELFGLGPGVSLAHRLGLAARFHRIRKILQEP